MILKTYGLSDTSHNKRSSLLLILFVLFFLQIGAYDQQIWEKSVEQREIKVPFLLLFSIPVFSIFPSLLRSFQISLLVIYPVTQFSVIVCFFVLFFFLLTLSSLVGVGGACAHLSSSSSSPSLLLHPLFSLLCSLFLW